MKKLVFSLCMLATSIGAMAQLDSDDKQLFNHLSLSAGVGTDGISIEAATPITPFVQMRAGVGIMPTIKVKNIKVNISSASDQWNSMKNGPLTQYAESPYLTGNSTPEMQQIISVIKTNDLPSELKMDAKLSMTTFKLLFDLYPTKTSAWHLTVGFYAGKSQIVDCYTTNCQSQLDAITKYNQNFAGTSYSAEYNGVHVQTITFPEEKIGVKVGDYLVQPNGEQAKAYVKVNGFRPYVGIGSGRSISNKHRCSLSWDLGCQFWGTPSIYVEQPDGQIKLDKNASIDGDGGIIKTISKISVYPTLSIRFNGRIL